MTHSKAIFRWSLMIVLTVAIVGTKAFLVNQKTNLPPAPAPKDSTWKEVFSDNFDGTTLDSSKWSTCYDWYSQQYSGCSNNGNHELEWYTAKQVTQHDGHITLTAITAPTKGWNGTSEQSYTYQSGMISTGRPDWNSVPKWTGTYGYFEARMRVPAGKGIWPAFWLVPADHSWPPEIDIMELLGDKPNNILTTYHWKGANDSVQKDSSIYTGVDFTKDWHTYAVNWQPGHIDWYIDGIKRKSVSSANVPSKPMEVVLNLAVGGDLPGNPDSKTPIPAQVDIDYVHIYSLNQK